MAVTYTTNAPAYTAVTTTDHSMSRAMVLAVIRILAIQEQSNTMLHIKNVHAAMPRRANSAPADGRRVGPDRATAASTIAGPPSLNTSSRTCTISGVGLTSRESSSMTESINPKFWRISADVLRAKRSGDSSPAATSDQTASPSETSDSFVARRTSQLVSARRGAIERAHARLAAARSGSDRAIRARTRTAVERTKSTGS